MTSRWSAERVVGPDDAAVLVARVAPWLAGLPVTPLAEGWDHTVHLVGDAWAFRFPRRAMALPGFRREIAALPRLAGLLPVPVPVPEHVGEDGDPRSSWPFAGAPYLPGAELADLGLADTGRAGVAAALGEMLRTLHALPPDLVGAAAFPVDPMGRGMPAARSADTRAALGDLARTGTWTGDTAVARLLDRADALAPPAGRPVLVHGDLHVRHVLVDEGGDLAGVIDWGDVCLGDPAVDLAVAYAAFAGPARGRFLAAYGAGARGGGAPALDGERELRARALAVRLSALLAAYAADVGRSALLAEALAGLRRATS